MAKMKRRVKTHPLDQSPLYKLKSRAKLASLLGFNLKEIEDLANNPNNYTVFFISKGIKKSRQIEKPRPKLEATHRKLFNWLRSIEHPEYLHSGIRGRSYITNAKAHVGAERVVTLDIKKFFPSTLSWHVYGFFREVMLCSEDVSAVLSKLCTTDGHVPTGSCLSQEIAYWAHCRMFDEINSLAQELGLIMTCYVDDITISGRRANTLSLHKTRGLLLRHSLTSHPDKERVYDFRRPSSVTGCIVTTEGTLLPNAKHKAIHDKLKTIIELDDSEPKVKMLDSVIGMSVAASQADPRMEMIKKLLIQKRIHVRQVITENS